jgi:hypothetical protein
MNALADTRKTNSRPRHTRSRTLLVCDIQDRGRLLAAIIVFRDSRRVTQGARIAEFALQARRSAASGWANVAPADIPATCGTGLNDA